MRLYFVISGIAWLGISTTLWALGGGDGGKSASYKAADYKYEVTGFTVSYEANNDACNEQNTNLNLVWDFGDGSSTSNLNTAEHTYNTMGNYFACLNYVNPESQEVIARKCKHIEIADPNICNDMEWKPVCGCDNQTYINECHAANYYGVYYWTTGLCRYTDFSLHADYTYTTSGASLQFINTSVGNYDTYIWDFGDGKSTKQRNPQHIFKQDGEYEVCLTVSSKITLMEQRLCETVSIKNCAKN